MKEYGDKLPADKKGAIEEALTGLKNAHQSRDFAGIEHYSKNLNDAWQAASQDLYNAQQQTGNPESTENAQPEAEKDNVQDVDFEEVK
jgi:molecular chaperone DnaK